MGVKLKDIVEEKEITFDDLSNKTLAVDAYNLLYQFITSIVMFDGSPLKDKNGNITAHLVGLMSRLRMFYEKKIKLVFVFDGKPHDLKRKELQRRKEIKEKAMKKLLEATDAKDYEMMKKYSRQTKKVDKAIVDETKKFLDCMGIPYVDAIHDAEPQAAYYVKKGKCHAVLSQDYDNLLFGAPRFVKNLSITGKRKIRGNVVEIKPKEVYLDETLTKLDINLDQLIALGILIGTDFNEKGIPKVGPKTALKKVKQFGDNFENLFESLNWNEHFDLDWRDIFKIFKEPEIVEKDFEFGSINEKELRKFLVNAHDFSDENVNKFLDEIKKHENQGSLDAFF